MNTRKPTNSRCCSSASVGVADTGSGARARPRSRARRRRRDRRASWPPRAARRRCVRARLRARPSRPASARRRARRRRPPTAGARDRTGATRPASSSSRRRRRPCVGARPTARRRARCRSPPCPPSSTRLVAHEAEQVRAVDRRAGRRRRVRSNVMWPSVRVPVLSVKSSVMLPRSSMLTSRFTSTFLRARRRDPVDRLTVTIAGSSCGVSPIAIASENSSASMNGRCSSRLITKIDTVSTPATRTSRNENFRSPTWNAVSAGRSPSPAAMRPNAVCMPVRTTTPPRRALAHDRSHQRARLRRARPAIGGLLDRHRLAGEHRLVALELGRLEQPDVGGDDVADRRAARRRRERASTTSTRCGRAVADDERGVPDLRVQRRDRLLGPVLVHEAEPDRQADDHADDHRVGRVAREARHRGRGEQQQEQRIAELTREDAPRAHRVTAQRVRPVLHEPARAPRRASNPRDRTRAHRARRSRASARRDRGLGAMSRPSGSGSVLLSSSHPRAHPRGRPGRYRRRALHRRPALMHTVTRCWSSFGTHALKKSA